MKYILAFSIFIWITDAYAYLDPGTGSLIIQSTIATITGGLFIIKTYWHKIKAFFCTKREKNKDVESSNES